MSTDDSSVEESEAILPKWRWEEVIKQTTSHEGVVATMVTSDGTFRITARRLRKGDEVQLLVEKQTEIS